MLKFKSNDVNHANLESVTDKRQRALTTTTVNTIQGFVQFSIIALGLFQLIGLLFGDEINSNSTRFMRTKSNVTPSERSVADFMRKNFFSAFRFSSFLDIHQLISARQNLSSLSAPNNTYHLASPVA